MTIPNGQERAEQGSIASTVEVAAWNLMRAPLMERELYLDRLASALLTARAAMGRGVI